jgi:type IV secretion system protein VirB9
MISRRPLIVGFVCLAIYIFSSAAFATTRGYVYQPGRVYTVNTALGVATQIIIEPEEKVLDFGTGFSAGWEIVRRDNIFYIKPKDVDAETNMYIRTEKRSYLIDLRLVSKDWRTLNDAKAAGVNYIVQFVYPEDPQKKANTDSTAVLTPPKLPTSVVTGDAPASKPIAPSGVNIEPDGRRNYHSNYELAVNDDSKWLAPLRVYDDGVFTYLHFAPGTPSAAIFGRSSLRAQEYVVNKTVASDTGVIVQGLHAVLIVRYGNNTVALGGS